MSVIYNQGTNYTLYYNALDYFKTIMTNHPSIAKVTTGDLMEVDTKEFPMYPIGNINIFNTNIQDSTTKFQIQLVIADKIKNKNNESNPVTNAQTIPFYGVDDTVDILANTLAIINDLTSYTEYSVAAFDIDGDITCEPFVDRFNNGLAGHVATFTLTTHNDRNRCLFFLINPSGSGYQIQNCTTSETYYAVLTQQVTTGSVFSSTYPYAGTCYEVLQSVEDYDNWNLVNLPVNNVYPNCIDCINAQTPTTTTTSTTSTTTTSTTTTTTTTTAAPTTTTTSTTTTTIAPASCPYSVGQLAEGGVIAYILQPGDAGYDVNQQKGYVATISDVSAGAEWGCQGTNVSGLFSGLGTGDANTIKIVATCPTPGIAARLCSDLVEGGYSDWYLPSLAELQKLCANRTIIGGFSPVPYWSSTQNGLTLALATTFSGACSSTVPTKSTLNRVRAIRSFICPATTTTTTLTP